MTNHTDNRPAEHIGSDATERQVKPTVPARDHEFMVVAEVAAMLRVSHRWVYDAAARGDIPSGKFGGKLRFRRVIVDRYTTAAFA